MEFCMRRFPSTKKQGLTARISILALLVFITTPALQAQSTDTMNHSSGDSLHRVRRQCTYRAVQFSLWRLPVHPEYPYRATDPRMREIIRFLERYPEIRDVVFHEYIRAGVSDWEHRYIYSNTPAYIPIPALENDARWNIARYGVPYDPSRPWTLRSSIDVRTLLEWLASVDE